MARRHGRALRGQRLRASVPHGHWKTTTFIGGLRRTGMTAPMVLDGPMTGAWFLAYVEQVLDVQTYKPERRFGDAVKGLHVYGAKVVRPTNLAQLIASKS